MTSQVLLIFKKKNLLFPVSLLSFFLLCHLPENKSGPSPVVDPERVFWSAGNRVLLTVAV